MIQRLSFLILMFFALCLQAQEQTDQDADTLVFEYAKLADQLHFNDLPYQSLDGFQTYRPIGRRHLPWARSGNLGTVLHQLLFQAQDWTIESHLGGYQPLLLTHDSIRYYRMSRPFTQLSYVNGAEAEQYFQAFHSQNLGEGLNLSFKYERITSEGFFLRQLTNHTRFHASFNARSRDQRFRAKGYFFLNNIEAQENGGIVFGSDDNPDDNTVLLDIELQNAQNRSRSQGVFVDQQYDLLQLKDSLPLLSLGYALRWTKAFRNYNDNVAADERDFFPNYYFDQNQSADSSYADEVKQELYLLAWENRFRFSYSLVDQHYFQNQLTDRRFTSHFVAAAFEDTLLGNALEARFEKGLSGFLADETDFYAAITFPKWKSFNLQAYTALTAKVPDFFWWRQRSNHYLYDLEWETSKSQRIGGKLSDDKSGLVLQLEVSNLQDWVYFDSLRLPQQAADPMQVVQLQLSKSFNFLRNFHLFNRLAYQLISDESLIPLPDLISYHSFYYENRFFKSSLSLQAGFDFYWVNEYQGYAYDPAMAQFHLRPQADALGNIQQLDFFLNLGLSKAARIMFKFENLLLPSFIEDSYRIQDYPIPGRVMKVGLSWRMLN